MGAGSQPAESACSRVPAEILLEIFTFLTPCQGALHACVLVCRQWHWSAVQVLWRRPRFRRLSDVERLAATLVGATGPPCGTARPYARLIETLSFSSLPEPDRSSPHLATLLDSIIGCMLAAASPPASPPAAGPLAVTTVAHGPADHGAVAAAIKRPRGFRRGEDGATRPHSAADLPAADTAADCVAVAASTGEAPKLLCGATEEPPHSTVDDAQLCYPLAAPLPAACAGRARGAASADVAGAGHASSLRQLDLRFCKGVRNYSLQRLAPRLAPLTVLNLAGGLRTDITIAKLSQHMCQLRRVSLAWTSNLTDFGVSELVRRCRSIESLDLTYCTQIEDTSMFAIAHNLRNLTALSVAYCAGVTDMGVREVAARCPRLRVLNVAKCLQVTDRARRHLEHQRVVARCDSLEPFSIYSLSSKGCDAAGPPQCTLSPH